MKHDISTRLRSRAMLANTALLLVAASVLSGGAISANAATREVPSAGSAVSARSVSETKVTGAAPQAAALTDQRFEIYYSANCKSASRIYTGLNNSGEAWINDTFNRTAHGTAGSGQKIRNNAASVVVNTVILLQISTDDGKTWTTIFGKTGVCQPFSGNLASLRNHNTKFRTFDF